MNSDQCNVVFAAISAICAVWGVKNAWKTESTGKRIKSFYKELKKKNDLALLSRKAKDINDIYLKIGKISSTVFGQRGNKKSEIEFYKDIKSNIDEVFIDFPSGYNKILDLLKAVNKAFTYCIKEEVELDKVPQEQLDYYIVEKKMHDIMEKLEIEVSKIKWN